MFSNADLSLAAWKMRKNKLVTLGFRYYSQNHRQLPVSIYSAKIVFEGGNKRIFKISK
jgi:hypothetical protein